jgi:SAM-dependent methyltransferase
VELWSAYDEMGERYARHAEDGVYNAHYDRPAVLGLLGDVRGLRVLDAGCGPGFYAEALLAGGAEVAGFDASRAMVDLARERAGARASIDRAELEGPLPYDAESFDRVVCALAIHYSADRGATFAELYRVLRPGGALVVSTQHPATDWLRKGGSYFDRRLETDLWDLADGPQEVRFWREPLSDLVDAATAAGFVIDRLLEPRPGRAVLERSPEDHAKLEREPGFLVLRLRRPAAPLPPLPPLPPLSGR